jgi:hypothetical protein
MTVPGFRQMLKVNILPENSLADGHYNETTRKKRSRSLSSKMGNVLILPKPDPDTNQAA